MDKIYVDELTGCYNRRFLYYWIENEVKRANRYSAKFTLILLDIDNFRDINNTCGHLEGDRILIGFADFLRNSLRETDSLVRYGGDEFIVLMPHATIKGTIAFAQRLLASLSQTEILNHKIRCSIGFSMFPADGTNTETLFNRADDLMYLAKRQGKNRIGQKERVIKKLRIPSPVTIGRDDEVNWCLNQLKICDTIFVAGEIGVGKTRLINEVKNRLNNNIFLRGNAYAALSSVPYHPFRNMFNELVNNHYALVQQVLKQIPESYQIEVAKLLPGDEGLRHTEAKDLDKYRLYNAVTGFFLKLSQLVLPQLTLVFFDDLHWVDRPSCELMAFLVRSLKANMKLLGTYRLEEIKGSQFTELLSAWGAEKPYAQLTVAPLTRDHVRQLLESMMGKVPQAISEFLYRESGGNPFFIEEILRELEGQKKLYWSGREWVFKQDPEITIPRSVDETIKRKLKFLDEETRKFLEIAAVFGEEFVAEIITMATRRNVGEVLQAFDEFRRLGLIKERAGDNYFFSEDIVRQVVYRNIPKADLIQYHKLVGETIENFYGANLSRYFEQLALHFTTANDPPKALHYSKEAALKARNNYAHDVAIKFFINALKYEEQLEEIYKIKFALADIYFWIGEYEKVIIELNTCLEINPHAYEVYENLGRVYGNIGDYYQSLKYYQQGLDLAQNTDAVYTFRLAIASVYMRLCQFTRAKKELDDIVRMKKYMVKKDVCYAYLRLGTVVFNLDKLSEAKAYLRKALKIAEAINDKNYIAACYQDLAICYQKEFNTARAESYLKKALAIDQEIGYLGGIVIAHINLGALYADYDLAQAEAYYAAGLSTAKLIGAKMDMVLLYNNLGTIYRQRARRDEALAHYIKSQELAKQIQYDEGILFTNLTLSEAYRERKMVKQGLKCLAVARGIAERLDINSSIIACVIEEIEYLLDARNPKRLVRALKRLTTKIKPETDLGLRIAGCLYQGRVMAQLKKYAQAHRFYERARAYAKSLSGSNTAGEIAYHQATVYVREHELARAKETFLEAKGIFDKIGNRRYQNKIENELAAIKTKQKFSEKRDKPGTKKKTR